VTIKIYKNEDNQIITQNGLFKNTIIATNVQNLLEIVGNEIKQKM
jgi:hypothetical protein